MSGEALERKQRLAASVVRTTAVPPEKVVRCVEHALTARRPKTRYRVGPGATVDFLLGRYVPDRLRDVLLRKMLAWLAKSPPAGA